MNMKNHTLAARISTNQKVRFMGEGRSHQEDAEISCCPGVGTAKADTFTLFYSNTNLTE
jgi:hypothetical protein